MIFHNLLGRDAEPLINADIGIARCLQYFEEDERLVARVFEVVCVGDGDVADVAGGEVEGSRRAGGLVDGQAGLTLEEVSLVGLVGVVLYM